MNWYHESEGKATGPITEEAIQALRNSGVVGPQTRVWREDWPDWRSAADVWPAQSASVPPIPSRGQATTSCAECGAAGTAMVDMGGLAICEKCKPLAVEKLREGLPLGGGPWRDGKILVMHKESSLPQHCLKCGEQSVKLVKKRLSWHHPLVYLTILPGVLIYLIVALCVRKTMTLGVPLCADCLGKRLRQNLIAWGGFLGAVGLFVAGASVMQSDGSLGGGLLVGGFVLLLASLFWIIGTQLILPKKIDAQHAWLAKAGRNFLDLLPQWPGK